MNGEGFSIEMMHGNWRESSSVRDISVTRIYYFTSILPRVTVQ